MLLARLTAYTQDFGMSSTAQRSGSGNCRRGESKGAFLSGFTGHPDSATPTHVLLEIRGLSVRFGGIQALDNLSFSVPRSRICSLIGPNGAGKTTLFNCLSRLYPVQRGGLFYEGRPLSGIPVSKLAALGISRTFQNLAIFRSMSVRENILVGAHSLARGGFLAHMLRPDWVRKQEDDLICSVDALMRRLQLIDVADRLAGELPLGTQKRVEFARALASRPKLLLLDEPAAGLNLTELEALGELIRQTRDELGITILLVEHHMPFVMRISDTIVALHLGRKIAEGSPQEIRRHPEVIRAYLGYEDRATDALA